MPRGTKNSKLAAGVAEEKSMPPQEEEHPPLTVASDMEDIECEESEGPVKKRKRATPRVKRTPLFLVIFNEDKDHVYYYATKKQYEAYSSDVDFLTESGDLGEWKPWTISVITQIGGSSDPLSSIELVPFGSSPQVIRLVDALSGGLIVHNPDRMRRYLNNWA